MNAYGIELRGIQYNSRMSEETNCYSAMVFVDGKHVFDASNHGHGGCDNFHPIKGGWTMQQIWDFDAKIKAESPGRPNTFDASLIMKDDLEIIFGEILTEWLILKDLKRPMRSKILFVLPGEKVTEGVRQIGYKGVKSLTPDLIEKGKAHVASKYPTATVLNGMTDEQLSALVKEAV